MKKKNQLFLMLLCLFPAILPAKNSTHSSNPDQTNTFSVDIETVKQYKNLSIEQFEAIIATECQQLGEFASRSVDNWRLNKIGQKTEAKAKKYSEKLMQKTVQTQSKLSAFPFDLQTYQALDSALRKEIFEQQNIEFSKSDLIAKTKKRCQNRLAPQKYFTILSQSQYSQNDQNSIDLKQLQDKIDKYNLEILIIDDSFAKWSKLTPKGVGQKLGLTDTDLNATYLFMANNIKEVMDEMGEPWYVYQYVVNKTYHEYQNFLINGGHNRQFAMIALTSKIIQSGPTSKPEGIDKFVFIDIEPIKLDLEFNGNNSEILFVLKLVGYNNINERELKQWIEILGY